MKRITEGKKGSPKRANFIRNRFSLFRRLTLLLGLLCVFTSFPIVRARSLSENQSDPIKSSKQQGI